MGEEEKALARLLTALVCIKQAYYDICAICKLGAYINIDASIDYCSVLCYECAKQLGDC